jgi:hypothetical protein
VQDIFTGHHYRASQPEASAISLRRGMDNECADFFSKVTDDHDYKPFIDAVHQGYLRESEIDVTLTRLFTARMKLGMFDPPEMVPYSKIDEKLLDSAEHRAEARKLANEAMVLLKNDGVLPLKSGALKIAVVGPLADQTKVLMGNYTGVPSHAVSVLDGLKAEFPAAKITYVAGTQFLRNDGTPVPNAVLTTPDGKPGVKADFRTGDLMGGGWKADGGADRGGTGHQPFARICSGGSEGQDSAGSGMDWILDADGERGLQLRAAAGWVCADFGGWEGCCGDVFSGGRDSEDGQGASGKEAEGPVQD